MPGTPSLPPATVSLDVTPADIVPNATAPTSGEYTASLEGCQVVARIDGQVVLACEVLWRVNQMIEAYLQKLPPEQRDQIPPEQLAATREQLLKREIAGIVDRKLLYAEFRRNVPEANLSNIQEQLSDPFEKRELPSLMKQLKVETRGDLEKELTRLGSSMNDIRSAFNEKAIAQEWMRSKIKINEEVSPDEMIAAYQAHLADYEYPTQVRWEELMVRKDKYREAREAYAQIAALGNIVWQQSAAQGGLRGPAFAELAKEKSDGFTAKEGGVHDWTAQDALKIASINEALFTLQVGQLSPIIEGPTGFHIVRVLERKEAGRRPFTEVQGEIRDKLKEERFQAAVEKYLGSLRKDARIWTVYTGSVSAEALLGPGPDGTKRK